MTRIFSAILAGAAGAAVLSAAGLSALADDDRYPTSEELAQIEQTLRADGFVRWEEVEFDDGMWEVDDARDGQNVEWDLKLDPQSYEIVRRVRED